MSNTVFSFSTFGPTLSPLSLSPYNAYSTALSFVKQRKLGGEKAKKCRAVLPRPHNLDKVRYHSTIAFPSASLAAVAGGNTYLWLFNTGARTADNSSDEQWEVSARSLDASCSINHNICIT